ncbi:hypothetical protein RJ55_05444 [Drechmeria coniospora]|nr:hypothetical protein RJ55_05444 [Drechmeria coniospora]
MLASALAFGLAGLAAASPIGERDSVAHYPATSLSKGFHLVVNVTDRCKDFDPPIHNTYITSIHTGAGLALVGNVAGPGTARIFYQNATSEQSKSGDGTVVTDSGTPPYPAGLKLVKDEASSTLRTAHLDAGLGTPGIGISKFPEPYAFLTQETWVACNESLSYFRGQHFIIFKSAKTTVGKDGTAHRNIPEGCAPVRLLPECTDLNALAVGSYASHAYALEGRCYQDVKSIKWSDFGP